MRKFQRGREKETKNKQARKKRGGEKQDMNALIMGQCLTAQIISVSSVLGANPFLPACLPSSPPSFTRSLNATRRGKNFES